MKLELRPSSAPRRAPAGRADAYVVFALKGAPKGGEAFPSVPAEVREAAASGAPPEGGADGTFWTAPLPAGAPAARLYVFGAGSSSRPSPRKARALLRTAAKTLVRHGEKSAILDFPFLPERMGAAEAREFLLRTAILSDYAFDLYKSRKEGAPAARLESASWNPSGPAWKGISPRDAAKELARAGSVAAVSALVRDLGNTPACDLTPGDFAKAAVREAKARSMEVRVLGRKEMKKERMGGLLAVARGSAEEPRLVVLEHLGGKKDAPPVALVGKGVTFDSGGISIKPSEKMGDMKWDMMGAATVLGVLLAARDLALPVNLVGVMAMAENLPSGTAYKPGDLVRFRNGKTAEIDNTDAEGRVILADALDYAGDWKPSAVVDYATLTGAAIVAIGLEAAVLFTSDDRLARELVSAGERTDERLWRLPLWDEYRENIKSDWADMKNTGGRWGGSINGAMFLKEFAPAGAAWAHLDIAPTANYDHEHAGYAPGATAFGVAMTLRWLMDRAVQGKKPAR